MFVRIWRFRARPRKVAEFRAVYGPLGDWAVLFAQARGYLGSELLASATDQRTCVTLDRWEDVEAWEAFLRARPDEYAPLDRRCESLTSDEAEVGAFHLTSAHE